MQSDCSWDGVCKVCDRGFSPGICLRFNITRKPSISGKPRLSNHWRKTELECLLPSRALHFLILTSIPVEFMTVAPSGPDWWLWNKQHNNVPGTSAPQVNAVYRRLSTAAPALCNRPDSLGINLTFPDSCSCHRTLKFIFLSLCREVFSKTAPVIKSNNRVVPTLNFHAPLYAPHYLIGGIMAGTG